MNIGERFMTPRRGESSEAFKNREERFRKKCEEVFGQPSARALLAELIQCQHPLQPRTHASLSPHESAFLDGEMSMLSFLILNSGQTDLLAIQPAILTPHK